MPTVQEATARTKANIAAKKASKGSATPVAAPATGSFEFVDTMGNVKNIAAGSAEEAMRLAPGIDSRSGVIAKPPGIGGPIVTGPGAGITASAGTSRADERRMAADITSMYAADYRDPIDPEPYLASIDKNLERLYDENVFGIKSSYESQKKDLGEAQRREVGTNSVGVARAGGYLGQSGSGQGVMNNLAAGHRAEMQDLAAKRDEALSAARAALANGKIDLAKLRLNEAKDYEKESYTRRQSFFEKIRGYTNQQEISQAIQEGAKTPQAIYDALGGKVKIEEIESFLGSYVGDDDSLFSFGKSDIPLLLGAGLSGEDIQAVQDYVNQNGYTDEFRATLSPRERKVLDSIYYPKAANGGVGGTVTISEAKSLGLPTSLIGLPENQVLADLQRSMPPQWYIEYVTSGWADPTVDPKDLAGQWQQFRSGIIGQNIGWKNSAAQDTDGGGGGGGDNDISFDEV